MEKIMLNLSLEFQLLILSCHKIPSLESCERMRKIVQDRSFSWREFCEKLDYHRDVPLVGNILLSVLDQSKELKVFESFCREIKKKQLQQYGELLKLHEILDLKKIPLIVLKGAWLSHFLYDDACLRQSKDIDLWVPEESLEQAHKVLLDKGYKQTRIKFEGKTKKQKRFYRSQSKDRYYWHKEKKIQLELHYQLTQNLELFPLDFKKAWLDRLKYPMGSQIFHVLSLNHLWLYQCYHGSMSGWYRLHWITDIHQLYLKHQPQWPELLEKAKQFNSMRSVVEACMLIHYLFNAKIPKKIEDLFRADKKTQNLVRVSLNNLQSEKRHGGFNYFSRMFNLHGRFYFLKDYLFHFGIRIQDCKTYPLPDSLFFLYYVIRPFSFIKRKFFY